MIFFFNLTFETTYLYIIPSNAFCDATPIFSCKNFQFSGENFLPANELETIFNQTAIDALCNQVRFLCSQSTYIFYSKNGLVNKLKRKTFLNIFRYWYALVTADCMKKKKKKKKKKKNPSKVAPPASDLTFSFLQHSFALLLLTICLI